jgi:hypothetical protein
MERGATLLQISSATHEAGFGKISQNKVIISCFLLKLIIPSITTYPAWAMAAQSV